MGKHNRFRTSIWTTVYLQPAYFLHYYNMEAKQENKPVLLRQTIFDSGVIETIQCGGHSCWVFAGHWLCAAEINILSWVTIPHTSLRLQVQFIKMVFVCVELWKFRPQDNYSRSLQSWKKVCTICFTLTQFAKVQLRNMFKSTALSPSSIKTNEGRHIPHGPQSDFARNFENDVENLCSLPSTFPSSIW